MPAVNLSSLIAASRTAMNFPDCPLREIYFLLTIRKMLEENEKLRVENEKLRVEQANFELEVWNTLQLEFVFDGKSVSYAIEHYRQQGISADQVTRDMVMDYWKNHGGPEGCREHFKNPHGILRYRWCRATDQAKLLA